MTLIYDPRDGAATIQNMELSIKDSKRVLDALDRASKQLIDALSGQTLTGEAYGAGKAMFEGLITPLLALTTDVVKDTESSLIRYKGAVGDVGTEYLAEDALNRTLVELRAQQKTVAHQIDYFSMLRRRHQASDIYGLAEMYQARIRDCEHYMDIVEEDIRRVEEKLRRVHTFNTTVNGLFNSSFEAFGALQKCITKLASTSFVSQTGAPVKAKADWSDEFFDMLFDGGEWVKGFVSSTLEETEKMTDKQWTKIGRGVSAQLVDSESSFVRWLSRSFDTMPNKFTQYLGTGAKVAGKALIAFDAWNTFNEYNDKYDNIGRGVVYSGVVTSVGFGVGEAAVGIGTSLATGLGAGAFVSFLAPIAAGVFVGAAVTVTMKSAYDHVPWFRDGIDFVGDGLNVAGEAIGSAVTGSIHSLKGCALAYV